MGDQHGRETFRVALSRVESSESETVYVAARSPEEAIERAMEGRSDGWFVDDVPYPATPPPAPTAEHAASTVKEAHVRDLVPRFNGFIVAFAILFFVNAVGTLLVASGFDSQFPSLALGLFLVGLGVGIGVVVAGYRLSVAIGGRGVAALVILIPYVGLMYLWVLMSSASGTLRRYGLRVGLLGVSNAELDRWVQAGCPAVPPGLAERLLGATRQAGSTATSALMADLKELARRLNWVLRFFVIAFGLGAAGGVLVAMNIPAGTGPLVTLGTVLIQLCVVVALGLTVAAWRLSLAIGGTGLPALLVLVPVVGIFYLLFLASDARKILRQHGLKVALLGVSSSEFDRVIRAERSPDPLEDRTGDPGASPRQGGGGT